MSQRTHSLDSSLLVRDVAGDYRPANADEVLQAAVYGATCSPTIHGPVFLSDAALLDTLVRDKRLRDINLYK